MNIDTHISSFDLLSYILCHKPIVYGLERWFWIKYILLLKWKGNSLALILLPFVCGALFDLYA